MLACYSTHTDNRIMIDPSIDCSSSHDDVEGSIIKIGCKMKPGDRVEPVSNQKKNPVCTKITTFPNVLQTPARHTLYPVN